MRLFDKTTNLEIVKDSIVQYNGQAVPVVSINESTDGQMTMVMLQIGEMSLPCNPYQINARIE